MSPDVFRAGTPVPTTTPAAGLQAESVGLRFGGIDALRDVTLQVRRGQVTGLIGPNGAGKSSLINVLTGFYRPTAGCVRCDGVDLRTRDANAIRRAGVSRTFQASRLFRELTVRENVTAAGLGLGWSTARAQAAADEVLALLGAEPVAGRPAGELSYTDQRRVAIARAIVGWPAYLLLDEPAAGMSEHEVGELGDAIARIATEHGTGVLLIEHNFPLVLRLCAWSYVLDGGMVVEAGDAAVIRSSERLRSAYLGATAQASA